MEKPSILVVDDTPANLSLMTGLLEDDYKVRASTSGEKALKIAFSENPPDLILLDIMMPEMDGHEVCKRLKASELTKKIPVIFLTAMSESEDEEKGLSMGAVDYITKPINPSIALARIKTHIDLYQSLQTIDSSNRVIQEQAEQLKLLNLSLEKKVIDQSGEIDKLSILKEFFSPQVSQAIVEQGTDVFKTHRKNITVVFLDLRGFTAFTDNAEPEEVMEVLAGYHLVMGNIINAHGGSVGHFAGDGIMIYFNDPISVENHTEVAARMCIEMQGKFKSLVNEWSSRGIELSLGIGLAAGYATLGTIGFEGRHDYGCIGSVCNLAARLCGEAKGGQTLINEKSYRQIKDKIPGNDIGHLSLKGLNHPVQAIELV
jgi:hypothetical protein